MLLEFTTSNSAIPYWLTMLSNNYFIFIYLGSLGLAYLYKKEMLPSIIFIMLNLVVYLDIIKSNHATFYDYMINFIFTCLALYNFYTGDKTPKYKR